MELVELAELGEADWAELIDGERQPWGPGEGLQWREKDRHLGLRAEDGRLLAVCGAVVAEVEVEGSGAFGVVGLGSLFVTRSERESGLASRLFAPLLELAGELGPDRAMLFCRAELVPFYRRMAFAEIAAPVWADQPGGQVEMPIAAMWRALRTGADWPAGRVDVQGLPF
jgi:predicted N-acetyltransferase YhbS